MALAVKVAVVSLLVGLGKGMAGTEEVDNCPVWSLSPTNCRCRPPFGEMVYCEEEFLRVQNCHCVWHDGGAGETVVFACPHTCYNTNGSFYYLMERTANYTEFNQLACSGEHLGLDLRRNASSRLCGDCLYPYGLALYSYQFSECILCHNTWYNCLAFIAMAFGPLTIFYFVVVTFRVSATSGDLNGYIFFSQVITSPIYMRLFINALHAGYYGHNCSDTYLKVIFSFYGIWNLDFFRLLYKPFSMHTHWNAANVLTLDYLVAIYPLVLILLTYAFIILYERNYRVVVCLWRPLHRFLARLRSQWSIRRSLVHAFSTFILLSYVKILSVSLDLLLPTFAYGSLSKRTTVYYYYSPNISVISRRHTKYFIIALFSFLLSLVPMLLLLAYPCRCCQRMLNIRHPGFHIFMDAFTGCYHQEPAYCRAFAGIYFLLRLLFLLVFEYVHSLIYTSCLSLLTMLAAILFAIVHPYKKHSHNIMDVVFLIYLAVCFNLQSLILFCKVYISWTASIHFFMVNIILLLPIFYPTYLFLRFCYRSSLVRKILAWILVQKMSLRSWAGLERQRELVDPILVDSGSYGATA